MTSSHGVVIMCQGCVVEELRSAGDAMDKVPKEKRISWQQGKTGGRRLRILLVWDERE